MIPVYALALGALAAALLGFPLGLLSFPALFLLPPSARAPAALGALLVFASLLMRPDPWQGRIGQRTVLEGPYLRGILHAPEGPIHPRLFPRPKTGRIRVEGRIVRPEGPRNPGELDRRRWLLGKGVRAELADARLLSWRPLEGLRAEAESRLSRGLSPPVAGLARALVLGEREALAEAEAFRRAGLGHLLALSGLHVGFLLGFLLVLLAPLGQVRYPLVLAVLAGYLALAGPSPSLVRAALMAAAVLLPVAFGRGQPALLPALALALAVQLVLWPWAVWDLGFRLSYLAVAGLGVILPPLYRPLARAPLGLRGILGGVLATLAAQAATLPLLLDAFGRVSLLSPVANLLALPLAAAFVPLGFLKLMGLGLVAPGLELTGRALLEVAKAFAGAPALTWGAIGPSGFMLYYLALAALVLALWSRLPWRRAAVVALLAAALALLPRAFPALEVWQLDVGEGHATLLRAPGEVEVLLDAGPRWAAGRVLRALRALGVDDLDLLVLTHPDRDHAGAAPEILRTHPVGAVLTSPEYPEDDPALVAARLSGVPHLVAAYGDRVRLGPLVLEVWHPRVPAPPGDNAKSLVVRARWRGRAVLVLGDLPRRFEDGLPALPADVLVASHHGAENGTGEAILKKARPRVVLIGVGKNPFGHPSPKTIQRALAVGAEVHRTDLEGALCVRLAPRGP